MSQLSRDKPGKGPASADIAATLQQFMAQFSDQMASNAEHTVRQVKALIQEEVGHLEMKMTSLLEDRMAAFEARMDTMEEKMSIMQEQIDSLIQHQLAAAPAASSPSLSYPNVTASTLNSRPSNLRTIPMRTIPSTLTDTPYCTVDLSRMEEAEKENVTPSVVRQGNEEEMRETGSNKSWRAVAVTKDPQNLAHVRISCRDEIEMALVKETAEKAKPAGARVLRDQWFPLKVNNVNRAAVLDREGKVKSGVVEMVGEENEAKVAKNLGLARRAQVRHTD